MNTEERGRMIGMTRAELQVERLPRPTRWSRRPLRISELSNSGPLKDRDAAIVALRVHNHWSTRELGQLFGISDRRVRTILRDFRVEVLGESG